jgi:hypothetical protein
MKYGLWAGVVLVSYVSGKVSATCCTVQHIIHTSTEGSTSCANDTNSSPMFHIPTTKKQKESQQQ